MRNRLASHILTICVILTICNIPVYADTIILKDGRKIEGFILEEKKDSYVIKISIGTATFNKEDISEIKRISPEENYVSFGNQFLISQNYDAALEQYKKALEINPNFQPAKNAIAQIEKLKAEAEEKKRAESERKERELLAKKEKIKSGFGMELGIVKDELNVLKTERNSPAETAGIKASDTIVLIDEQTPKDKSFEETLNYLLKPGTALYKFTVQRNVVLTRKRIEYQKRPVIGVGIFLDADQDGLLISSVITGEPADLAGLRTKDRLIAIDNTPTKGISLDEVSNLIGGSEATNVKLTIQRDVELERR